MIWMNLVAVSGLFLSRDSNEVKVTNSGNYFLYATVKFTKNTP